MISMQQSPEKVSNVSEDKKNSITEISCKCRKIWDSDHLELLRVLGFL